MALESKGRPLLLIEGKTLEEWAKETGVEKQTFYKYYRRNGLQAAIDHFTKGITPAHPWGWKRSKNRD